MNTKTALRHLAQVEKPAVQSPQVRVHFLLQIAIKLWNKTKGAIK